MKVNITETVLRDANQSLIATRMPLKDFVDILETMDEAGYYSLECWGGATFDSCLRYLDEDPWERLRTIRKHVKKTKLQMLLRGQNILGYKHYPDDIVRAFVRKSVENGIDIIRIFDALNDLRNIEVAVDEAVKAGAHVQGALCYTISPIHNQETFVELAKQLEKMGCHSICIKDMAGIMSPKVAYDLVSAMKKSVKLPIVVHTHSTTGLGPMTLLKAVEAGADTIDTAISCFSGGTSQPATESLSYSLKEMGFDTGLKEDKLKEINDFFKPVQSEALASGLLNPIVMNTETDALVYQVPGGMLSNLVAQLKAQNALDRFPEVLLEVPRVREDLGYPPLVTPSSQMVGVQAATNVLVGERYKNVSKEIKAYLHGEYGRAPGKVNEELRKKVLGDEKPIECRYADLLQPGFEKAKAEIGDLAKSDEDVLSYVAFPQIAEKFLKNRAEKEKNTVHYTIEEA
ncbi:MAG TPA: oxaloacetate decarboxylase subunit alpha [Candidatus Ventrousia excrementavium]|uniref:Oxaloacetate decarboxylase subunit alpha n=1 Tax=Candidatus Ventrousia excrementavium TaxID=2840961 RepID=A0A9D1IXT5_9CLOT|nr:oxaloacetate decarboxylase subunit alpha [Candidatus Ventrousia excrementavium]